MKLTPVVIFKERQRKYCQSSHFNRWIFYIENKQSKEHFVFENDGRNLKYLYINS